MVVISSISLNCHKRLNLAKLSHNRCVLVDGPLRSVDQDSQISVDRPYTNTKKPPCHHLPPSSRRSLHNFALYSPLVMAKVTRKMWRHWWTSWRMRLERKGAVAPGNAAAGRVHHEFEETAMAAASRGGATRMAARGRVSWRM